MPRGWRRRRRSAPHVMAAAPYVQGQAMLSAGEVNRGVIIRGVDTGQRGEGRRHRRAHARGFARCALARQVRHRAGRRDRARDGAAHGRPGRRHRAAGHADRGRHAAATQDVSRRRRVRGRHVRIRQRARADRHRRRAQALPAGRRQRRAVEARRPLRGAGCRARPRGHARRQRRDPRLDDEPRQFLPRGADREARDVHHPDADHRGRGVQHRLGAGDDGHRQEGRHRDPAHAGRVAGLDHARSS